MKKSPLPIAALTLATLPLLAVDVTPARAEAARPLRPVHTYSIVARDADSGEMGVAVQSHWFSVGSIVTFAEPGVGAVATQSFVEPAYGPMGLALMRNGKSAPEALKSLLASDEFENVRQVAMIDASGAVANHTGKDAIAEYCNLTGDNYAVQANMMWKPTVCRAMAGAFEASDGDLAERLMAALEAAEGEGGDVRGSQSAALLVVSGDISEPAWAGREFDLRVEDHTDPVGEMRRLLTMARAYRLMNQGDEYMTDGDVDSAVRAYGSAEALVPDSHEMVFWHGAALAAAGDVDAALPLFRRAFAMWPRWRVLVQRLPAAGLLPDDEAMMQRILAVE